MHKNRVKIVLALTLTVAILICNTVSVFAYEPIVVIKSSEWEPLAETFTAYSYPNGIMIGDDEQEFKKFEDLYGDTCYFSSDYTLSSLESVEISINPDDYKYDGFYIFEHSNSIYLYNYNPEDFTFFFDEERRLKIHCWNSDWDFIDSISDVETYFDIYFSTYPYNSFELGKSIHFKYREYSIGTSETERCLDEIFSYHNARYIYPDYSTSFVYNIYENGEIANLNDILSEPNLNVHDTVDLDISLTTPLKLYTGIATFELTKKQVERLNVGRYAFVLDNSGFINGYDSRYAFLYFQLQVYDDEFNHVDDVALFTQSLYDSVGFTEETKPLPAYQGIINDYVMHWDNKFIDTVSNVYNCRIAFSFACDTFAAFFPGDIEIVEYESYEDDVEHKELMDNIDILISGDTGVNRVVIDTSDVDKITVEEESILDKVYGDIDSQIDKYLPEGYKDPYEYLNDSISDFNSLNSTFAFIKEFYDRTVEATGMGAVILFVLSFGFATYAIGRRLS